MRYFDYNDSFISNYFHFLAIFPCIFVVVNSHFRIIEGRVHETHQIYNHILQQISSLNTDKTHNKTNI